MQKLELPETDSSLKHLSGICTKEMHPNYVFFYLSVKLGIIILPNSRSFIRIKWNNFSTVLNRSIKSGHLCLVLDLREKPLCFTAEYVSFGVSMCCAMLRHLVMSNFVISWTSPPGSSVHGISRELILE